PLISDGRKITPASCGDIRSPRGGGIAERWTMSYDHFVPDGVYFTPSDFRGEIIRAAFYFALAQPMQDQPNSGERGETVPLNWACTNCGYRIEGELSEKCPDCGADRESFEEVPIPGF
ncbi:MAG: hypothetical protein M3Q54_11250, partial [Actinomycetota bacterium]|nr:hypothetical protein [Actinomycetota bacterium]